MTEDYPVGTCTRMCTKQEIIERQENRLLHVLEIIISTRNSEAPEADPDHVVKEYCRSAAGMAREDINNLRTPQALKETVEYLLTEVIYSEICPWYIVYDFIANRLRAVRKDMIIQNISKNDFIELVEPMVKFYVYAEYRLCEKPDKYDAYLNKVCLQECLKRLLCMYDEYKVDKWIPELKNRSFMEALYLILNINETAARIRCIGLPKIWRNAFTKRALNISLEYWRKNYVRAVREICKLPTLLLMCAVIHIPAIRRDALQIMNKAYRCKSITFPSIVIKELFIYNDLTEVLADCTYYGIKIAGGNLAFYDSTFRAEQEQLPTRLRIINRRLHDIDISDLILPQ